MQRNRKTGVNGMVTSTLRSCAVVVIAGGISVLSALAAEAKRPYYNDKAVPEAEDLMAIQKDLQKNLAQARAATVCIQIGKGSGSGVIVSESGLILTAAHVSSAVGKKMNIVMEDGTKHKVISLGLHSETDAAMLQILEKGKYPFVKIDTEKSADTATTKLGDWVFALGHSGGYDKARGSVVRLGRLGRIAGYTVQSDCKLIGGDSGGPLFDMNGVLVAIHSRVGKVNDMNMHVPMHVFHEYWDQMLKNEFIGNGPFAKKPVIGKAFIGIGVEEVENGLKIIDVDEESSAGKLGIQIGDVLQSVNGKKMTKRKQLVELMKSRAEGDELTLELLQNGVIKKLKITLGKR